MEMDLWISLASIVFGSIGVVLNLIALRQNLRREKARRISDQEHFKVPVLPRFCPSCRNVGTFSFRGDEVTCAVCKSVFVTSLPRGLEALDDDRSFSSREHT